MSEKQHYLLNFDFSSPPSQQQLGLESDCIKLISLLCILVSIPNLERKRERELGLNLGYTIQLFKPRFRVSIFFYDCVDLRRIFLIWVAFKALIGTT